MKNVSIERSNIKLFQQKYFKNFPELGALHPHTSFPPALYRYATGEQPPKLHRSPLIKMTI